VTTAQRAARAIAHARLRILVNVIRATPWRRRALWLMFAGAIALYAVQMAKVAAGLTPDPTAAVAVVSATFAALGALTAVRVASAAIQWVAEAPDIRLLGSLPTPRSALFGAHFASVLAEAARMQIITIPVVIGCAVASDAGPPRVAAYAVAWVCVVAGVSAGGSTAGVFVARWMRPSRARLTFRLLSLVGAIAVFGAFMIAADVGGRAAGRELSRLVNAPSLLAWLPTSWVAKLLFGGGWLNFVGIVAFGVGATGGAGWVFARWFDVDSAMSSAYAFTPTRAGGAGASVGGARGAFAALILKDIRSSFRSATVVAQWLGPIVLILVYARIRGGSAGPMLAASVLHIVALVASMTVGHGLAREEADAGWVIRLHARREGQATLAKVTIVWAMTAVTCLAAMAVVTGAGSLSGCLNVLSLSLGHAAFGIAVERAMPGARNAGKRPTPSLLGIMARQLYTGVAIALSAGATLGAPWLVAAQPLLGVAALLVAEKYAPADARRW